MLGGGATAVKVGLHPYSEYNTLLSSQMTQRRFLAGGVGGVTTTTTTTGGTGSVLSDCVKQRGMLVNGISNGGIGTMAPGFVVPAFMSGYTPGFGELATTPAPVKEKKEVNVGYWVLGEEEENVARPTPPYFYCAVEGEFWDRRGWTGRQMQTQTNTVHNIRFFRVYL